MAVQSEKNNTFVQDLQQLPLEHQHTLMGAIEETMSQLGAPSTGGDTFSSDNNKDMLSERTIMEKKISDLEKSLVSLKVESDSALQEEIEGLKVMLISSQSKNTELESQLSKEKMIVRELGNDAENSASCDDELRIARQELDVLRRIVDGRQPNKEMSIVKTKEKKAEANEIEKAVSMLESQLLSSNQKNTHLTEQLQKFNGLKSVVDAYKAQIANLEDKNTTLHVDNTILSFQVHDAAQKASRYEFERVQEFEKIAELQDQIKDLGFYNVFIVESNSLNAFAVDSVPAEVVNERVSFLESELQRFRTQAVEDKKRGDQIQLYEQILSDSKILCEKFETNYRMVLADNIILKGKVEQLSFSEFVVKKEEYEQSLKIAQDLTIDNASLDSELKSLVTLHENLRKIYEDTLRELDLHKQLNNNVNASLNAYEGNETPDETIQNLRTVTKRLVSLTEQNTQLHTALKRAKEHILSQDRRIKSLQNEIGLNSGSFSEAVTSLEASLAMRLGEVERLKSELNDTRSAAKREQRLIMSAWQNLGLQLSQHEKNIQQETDLF